MYDESYSRARGQSALDDSAHEQILAECIDTRTGTINTAGGAKPVFILEFDSPGLQIIKYFNCKLTPKGNHAVSRDSDFAHLFRLTLGEINPRRFSRAQQLMGHFRGYRFYLSCTAATLKNRSYLKVVGIRPETPIVSDKWTATGARKTSPKPSRQRQRSGEKSVTIRQQFGDEMATKWRKVGNKLATTKRCKQRKHSGLSLFSIPLNHSTQ